MLRDSGPVDSRRDHNRIPHLREKRKMKQMWSDYSVQLKSGAVVIQLPQQA